MRTHRKVLLIVAALLVGNSFVRRNAKAAYDQLAIPHRDDTNKPNGADEPAVGDCVKVLRSGINEPINSLDPVDSLLPGTYGFVIDIDEWGDCEILINPHSNQGGYAAVQNVKVVEKQGMRDHV